ncbi:MAG TPA: DUF5915 domain-containing protein, partial [Gemmatimonadales bacterium]|nr:DUF5915 domain-containing protein [Gemmatimonadales bacterium]
AAAAVALLSRAQLLDLENGRSVTLRTSDGAAFDYRPQDVRIEREVATDWIVESQGAYVVALDPALTDELRLEGLAREVVSRVQRLRKEAGYDYTTRIDLSVSGSDEVVAAARGHGGFIAHETLARQLEIGIELAVADVTEDVDIDGRRVRIAVRRHSGAG